MHTYYTIVVVWSELEQLMLETMRQARMKEIMESRGLEKVFLHYAFNQ